MYVTHWDITNIIILFTKILCLEYPQMLLCPTDYITIICSFYGENNNPKHKVPRVYYIERRR